MLKTKKILFPCFCLLFLGAMESYAQGDAAVGKSKSATCATCHGQDGISINDLWPNLAGQKSAYLIKQLTAFKDGSRKDPSMSALTGTLSETDINDLAAYYSSLGTGGNSASAKATTSAATVDLATADKSEGQKLYDQNCGVCHQADAIGKPGTAPSLTNKELLANASDEFFLSTIRDGRPGTGMPPFGHLGESKIASIVAFIRDHETLPNKAKEVDSQPKANGDLALGDEVFHQICSTCHGEHGDGYSAGGTGTAIGTAGFLDKVSDGFIRTTIKEGRSNTRMLGFQGPEGLANLTDEEIDSIIVYLRSLPGTTH